MRRSGLLTLAACLLVITSGPVLASGFSIYEQSAKASGQAGAWVARADDAAANWYNPAALTRLDGMQVQFGANLITVGSDTEFTINDAAWQGIGSVLTSSLISSGTKYQTESSLETPIHLYFTHKINDRFAWGIGVNNPYGLSTEWSEIPVTLSSHQAELVAFVVNPNVAFAINDRWSVALGVDYMFADVSNFSRHIQFLQINPAITAVGHSNLTGDGSAWGWNAALHYGDERLKFGLTYRGEMSPEIDGNAVFTDIPAILQDLFPDGPGKTTLDLPAQAALGIAYKFGERWTVEFDVSWAGWSSFKQLALDFENNTVAVQDTVLREDWEDTQAYRLGVAWALAERHELRFGALTDTAPVPGDTLRPSIPDSDRKAVTIGYGYKGGSWSLDAYYMPLWFDDITANGSAVIDVGTQLPERVGEGVINGEYTSFTHLAGLTFSYRF